MNSSIILTLRDEIALEGLAGITFEALFIRLEERSKFLLEQNPTERPLFTTELLNDDKFQNVIFKIVLKEANNGELQFYRLSSARGKLVIYNRNDHFLDETGTLLFDETQIAEDIYSPVVCINDDNVYGSCVDYNSRTDITSQVMGRCKDFQKFKKTFKMDSVVLVASQKSRATALLGPLKWTRYKDLRKEVYVILEAIGRKRWYGQLNTGKEAIKFQDARIKSSFPYYKKLLQREGLLLQFMTFMYHHKRKQCTNSLTLYLARFRPKAINPIEWKALKLADVFKERKIKTMKLSEVKQMEFFQGKAGKKVKDFLQRFPSVFNVRKPNEEDQKEFIVDYLRPLDRHLATEDLYETLVDNEEDVKNEDGEEMEDSVVEDNKEDLTEFRFKMCQVKRYFVERVCNVIDSYGVDGITRMKLVKMCMLPNQYIRAALRMLTEQLDLVTSEMRQEGRQKIHFYRTKRFLKSTDQNLNQSISKQTHMRIEMILDYLRQFRYCDSPSTMRKYINDRESDNPFKIDSKSILRLFNQLQKANFIYGYHFRVSYKSFFRSASIVVYKDSSVENGTKQDHNDLLDHLLLKCKFMNFAHLPIDLRADITVQSVLTDEGLFRIFGVDDPSTASTESDSAELNTEIYPVLEPSIARKYGCLRSKTEKVFQLYRFLFCILLDNQTYTDATDWRHYVPKMNRFFPDRYCFLIDVLLYMPISIFRSIVNLKFVIPGFMQLLQDSRTVHQLLYQVEPNIRRHLLHSRKLMVDIYELLNILSYFKLITITKEKDSLTKIENTQFQLNTSVHFDLAEPIGDENVKSDYTFNTVSDFDQFVDDVNNHMFNFNDGCTSCPFDSRINIHSIPLIGIRCSSQALQQQKKLHRMKRKQNLKSTKRRSDTQAGPKQKKVKVTPDSVDPAEKRKKKSFRITWTRKEDNFLIKCRIVSMLIDPNNRFQLCVPTSIARDMMIEHFGDSSANKDTPACARRLLYLNRKPHIQRILKFCIEELSHQNLLESQPREEVEHFNANSQTTTIIPLFKSTLKAVLDYRFVNTEYFVSPRELKQIKEKYEVGIVDEVYVEKPIGLNMLLDKYEIINLYDDEPKYYYFKPKNYYDIHAYVITNILVSSLLALKLSQHFLSNKCELSSVKLKKAFMRTIFKALKHFPETLVKFVVKRLVQFDILAHSNIDNTENNKQPVKSKTFAYQITKNFFDKVTCMNFIYDFKFKSSCTESDPFGRFVAQTTVEDNNSISCALNFAESFNSDIMGFAEPLPALENFTFHPSNEIYSSSSLASVQFNLNIPSNFIRIPNETVPNTETKGTLSRRSLLSRNSLPGGSQTSDAQAIIHYAANNQSNDDMLMNHCKVQSVQYFNSKVSILSPKVIDMFRTHLRVFDTNEFSTILTDEQQRKLLNDLLEANEFNSKILTVAKMNKVIQFIRTKNELGVYLDQLLEHLKLPQSVDLCEAEEELTRFLYECEKSKLIFSVGVLQRAWVHRDHIRFWLLTSYENLDDSDHSYNKIHQICFLPKLWRLPDGQLECNTLFAYLNHLIGYLTVSKTSVDQKSLLEHYQSLISPVQLLELIDILIAIESIRKCTVMCGKRELNPTNFDHFFQSPSELMEMELEPVVTYEASTDAYSRLFALHYAIKRSNMEEKIDKWILEP